MIGTGELIGAGIGLLGSLFGRKRGNPMMDYIISRVRRADDAAWDLFNRYGTMDALERSDASILADLQKVYTAEADLDRKRFLSSISDEFMPGMSDSEWALAQGAISKSLAEKTWAERARLAESRAMRSKALMPDASAWTSMTGAASQMDASRGGFGDILSVLSQVDWDKLFEKKPKQQKTANGGDTSSSYGNQSQVSQVRPASLLQSISGKAALQPYSTQFLGQGLGGGSRESVNARYGGEPSLLDRVGDLIYNGKMTPIGNRRNPMSRY